MKCLRQPQPTLKASFSHAGDAKANKKRDSSGDVFGRIARSSGWINRPVDSGDESLDNHLSRAAGLKVDGESAELVTYSYVGEPRYVKIAYPEPGIELSYIKNSGEPERDSGDPYTGYDRFGRTVDMKWQTPDGATMLDRVQYGYDRSSSRTWRRDLAAPAGRDEFFRYDALHQVTDLARGNLNLNQTAIGGIPGFEERFEYDRLVAGALPRQPDHRRTHPRRAHPQGQQPAGHRAAHGLPIAAPLKVSPWRLVPEAEVLARNLGGGHRRRPQAGAHPLVDGRTPPSQQPRTPRPPRAHMARWITALPELSATARI